VLILRVPTLFSGFLIGWAVDRWGARRMAAIDLVARATLLVLLIGCGITAGELPLTAVLILGGMSGAAAPATYAAIRWSVPRLVPPELLGRANAVIGLSEQLPLLISGALVGPALAVLGPVYGIAVPAGLLLAALVLARRLPTLAVHGSRPTATAAARMSMPERDNRRLPVRVIALIMLSTAYYFVYGPFETVMPSFVRDRLHSGQGTYSLLWALFGLGATATLPLGALLARNRPGLINAAGAAIWGLLMLPLIILDNTVAVAVLFLISGAVWGPYTTIETSALQRWVQPTRHGSVFGLQRGLLGTAAPVGAAVGAVALQHIAPQTVLAISAAACTTAGLIALLNRDLRRSHPPGMK
jgi:MFS family permease